MKGPVLSEWRDPGGPRRESKGTLYVVATPIGHLEDITLRALRILKTVQLVAAEDTRRTGNLLRHYNIDTAVLSVHEHNEGGRVARLLTRLAAGDSIALVTDAGTPGVSDPGATLVAAVREAGFRVEPIPGASAVVTAISASGMKSEGFCFHGFAPIKAKDRKLWFLALVEASQDRAAVFFEAPHRLRKTLEELRELVKCQIMVARELTKIHEEFVFGTPDELLARFETPQGEFTLVLPPGSKAQNAPMATTDEDIATLFGQLTEKGLGESKRDTARLVAEQLGLTTKVVYDALERVKITRG
ncbi:MAG: 16S rRNA (cytidine(1402)-2'-O)-methyltransferase [Acidobacteriota bacterium]|nr:16S rRNA (cytidine(1402)-2'-O)-methyltransferase [Acidobacteriota bacterium]